MAAIQTMLGVIAGILVVISYIPYTVGILKRKTKPSKATWLIWGILALLTASGMWEAGALSFQMTAIVAGDILVIALAFSGFGSPGWKRIEVVSLIGAAFGFLFLFVGVGYPNFAIAMGLSLTIIGSFPTIAKTWHYPEEEDGFAYSLMVASCPLQFFAVEGWAFADIAQPIVFFFIGCAILTLILFRPRLTT